MEELFEKKIVFALRIIIRQILILRLPENTSDDDLFLLMHANVNLMWQLILVEK